MRFEPGQAVTFKPDSMPYAEGGRWGEVVSYQRVRSFAARKAKELGIPKRQFLEALEKQSEATHTLRRRVVLVVRVTGPAGCRCYGMETPIAEDQLESKR